MRVHMDEQDENEVQLGPLIDCVFLLLIFFIVLAVTKKKISEVGIDAPPPAANLAGAKLENTMVIRVGRTRQDQPVLSFGGTTVPMSDPTWKLQLSTRLSEAAQNPLGEGPLNVRFDLDRRTQVGELMQLWNHHLSEHRSVPWRMRTAMQE